MKHILLLVTTSLLGLAGCVIPVDQVGRPTQLPQRPGYRPQRPGYATQLPDRAPAAPGYVTQLPDWIPVGAASGGLTVQTQYQGLVVRENGVVKTQIRTAMPVVERHSFTNGNQRIIVKSRGNHGPATVEMFDVRTGVLRDKVLAFAIRSSGATWAYGFED
jgi:hypothetical protein